MQQKMQFQDLQNLFTLYLQLHMQKNYCIVFILQWHKNVNSEQQQQFQAPRMCASTYAQAWITCFKVTYVWKGNLLSDMFLKTHLFFAHKNNQRTDIRSLSSSRIQPHLVLTAPCASSPKPSIICGDYQFQFHALKRVLFSSKFQVLSLLLSY